MSFGHIVQEFLKKTLEERNWNAKIFAQESQIPYPTVNKLLNAIQLNPDFQTIFKIAICCNYTIDEVIGRDFKKDSDIKEDNFVKPQNHKFNNISLEQVNLNLRNFISSKLEEENLTSYELSRLIGFSSDAIRNFIKKNNPQKTLGILIIIALADYFKVPLIDIMIGRVLPQNQEPQTL